MSEKTELRDGDVFRWGWIDPPKTEAYWCKSREGIFNSGNLYDTFWIHHGSKFIQGGWGPEFSGARALPIEQIEITVIGNIHDMNEIPHGDERYYDPSDVVDLRHSNNRSAPLYIKKGAKRSAKKMAERIRDKMVDAERTRLSAEQDLEALREKLAYVEAGENLDSVWF